MKLDPQFLAVHELSQVSLVSFGIAFNALTTEATAHLGRIDTE